MACKQWCGNSWIRFSIPESYVIWRCCSQEHSRLVSSGWRLFWS